MNISERIVKLEKDISEARRAIFHDADVASRGGSGEDRRVAGQRAAERFNRETAEWAQELDALKAPIISMVNFNGRLIVATAANVFELVGDRLVLIGFEVREAA